MRKYIDACAQGGPGVMQVANVAQLNQAVYGHHAILCIRAGDYRSAGKLKLQQSLGLAPVSKILIFYHPDVTVALRHPVDRAIDQQAIVSGINFEGADAWLVHGITVRPVDGRRDKDPLIWFRRGESSNNNVMQQLLVEGGGGGGGQIFFSSSNDHNVIRRSVVRQTSPVPGEDSHCIKIDGSKGVVIEDNEIYDCAGDAIQIGFGGAPAGRIAGNDLFITPAMFTDCLGRRTTRGHCACAENAIDLKGGGHGSDSDDSSQVLEVLDNHMWGFRKTDEACAGTGDMGNAVVIHWEAADYVLFSRNVIGKSDRGINVADYSRLNPLDGTQHVSIRGNLFFAISGRNAHRGRALLLKNASRYEVYGNIFIDVDEVLGMGDEPGSWNEFACNLVIDSGSSFGRWGEESVVSNNAYSGTPVMRQDRYPLKLSAKRDARVSWCVTMRRSVANEETCMQGVSAQDIDAWVGHCANTRAHVSVGVDDVNYSLDSAGVMSVLSVRSGVVSSSSGVRTP